ncbi:uncharacterized protein CIMG_12811 [Coccidioides immitis RS]|uniref:Uncharacterized protein n=1 Tax=Coccidioides immitis (strain RS) TaxID=246410 RepID=A0A0D8JSY3_COCIM|nr:uncharacterized protein CIMG_12811 [Coccidioides immitis RS]KJF60224.1 hypothetical protein CIMG_12811 [Coccidioides immitis RS]
MPYSVNGTDGAWGLGEEGRRGAEKEDWAGLGGIYRRSRNGEYPAREWRCDEKLGGAGNGGVGHMAAVTGMCVEKLRSLEELNYTVCISSSNMIAPVVRWVLRCVPSAYHTYCPIRLTV